jgi:ribose transport system ATP-binding protein
LIGDSNGIALSVAGVTKSFGGERALRGLSLTVKAGEIHGVVGENGSGKSTLIKILAGFHAPDTSTPAVICGNNVDLPLKPGQAASLGIAFVHQELGLINGVSVLENLLIDDFAGHDDWLISWFNRRSKAASVLSEFDLSLDLDAMAGELRPTDRALLAVVRAANQITAIAERRKNVTAPGLLVLDEPTVYLPEQERKRLFDLMRTITQTGVAILFVAHDVDEVLSITNRVTVLRDGLAVGTVDSAETSTDELIALILGSAKPARAPQHRHVSEREAASLMIDNLAGQGVRSLSITARTGDIIGLTGLPGSGFDDVPYLLFGALKPAAGTLEIGGRRHDLSRLQPGSAVGSGIALIPADRARAGSVVSLTVADNVSLQVLSQYRRGPFLSRRAMLADAAKVAERFDVRPRDPRVDYSSLSGGNQQKVLIAKWLQAKPNLLLLHEPTQGVDVGARVEIFRLLTAAARDGCVILVASTDHEQLAAICNRVLVTRAGLTVHDIADEEIKQETITELSYGAGTPQAAETERRWIQ